MATNPPDKGDPRPPPPPDKEEPHGIPDEKLTDANYLVTYIHHLERRLKNSEEVRLLLDSERLRLERELHSLRTELDRLRQPPLVEAKVIKVLPDGRTVVESSTGPRFVVNHSKKLKGLLQAGQHVSLNQRTFAVVEVIPLDDSEIRADREPVPVKVVSTSDQDKK